MYPFTSPVSFHRPRQLAWLLSVSHTEPDVEPSRTTPVSSNRHWPCQKAGQISHSIGRQEENSQPRPYWWGRGDRTNDTVGNRSPAYWLNGKWPEPF
ncbi:hypothetical protein BDV30DRAFT_221627 [Aspergillus minisclerotigenes]|uniref:Uncharacterized protein n=1 Tax=Aspergillus minisclerotigenes TaxID=656917 RepID=A0A5N6IIM2_9EURO|nr:hypothetical protein BDV30DRAFT_221627 [Aspergillus minisclerotigenes]